MSRIIMIAIDAREDARIDRQSKVNDVFT